MTETVESNIGIKKEGGYCMDTRLVRFTRWLLDVMFYGGIVVTLGIPLIFHYVGKYIEAFRIYYIPQCILYIGSGILCLLIVLELRRMFDTVLADNAFVMENAGSLKRIGKFSFFLAILSLVRVPIAPTPATAVVIIVFSIAGIFCFVLCQVFERAVQYKEENDLTI